LEVEQAVTDNCHHRQFFKKIIWLRKITTNPLTILKMHDSATAFIIRDTMITKRSKKSNKNFHSKENPNIYVTCVYYSENTIFPMSNIYNVFLNRSSK